jgi:hypothetical protein
MKLFTLPNVVSHDVTETTDLALSSIDNPRLDLPNRPKNKDEYMTWCGMADTRGIFMSAFEGVTPSQRITKDNPAKQMHGVIADYDADTAMDRIDQLSKSTAYLPQYVVATFTPGKARLIWIFEEPVYVLNEEVYEEFIKELDKKVRIKNALPGFDKKSFEPSQYFEMGDAWKAFNEPQVIPSTLLEACMLVAAEKCKITPTDAPVIPLDVVAAEVQAQFPNRLTRPFELGMKQPLFWLDDGVQREGAVITENGMVCFSDRAGTNFKSWRSILGAKFVERYEAEQTGKVARLFWFDGKHYWTKHNGSSYVYLNKEDAKLHLKGAGCDDRPSRGSRVSEVERVLIHVHTARRVTAAVPVLFAPDEIVEWGGERYLNISNKRAMQPGDSADPAKFPWLHEFMMNAFDSDQDGVPAWQYFVGWFRRFYGSALDCKPLPGQVCIIAGEAHTGKSFLNKWVIGEAVGGSVDAEPLLLKQTSFNKQGAECALWRCDDAATDGDWKNRQLFSKSLKQMAANPTQLYQPKFRDSLELPFLGRVVVTCNVDAESLKILPTLDGTIRDKVMLFKLANYRPHFYGSNYQNEERVKKEMPYFLRWVLDVKLDERIEDPVYKRFGVRSFHHQDLVHQAQVETREYIFSEILDRWINAKRSEGIEEIEITCTELLNQLSVLEGVSESLRKFDPQSIGTSLKKLLEQKMVPELIGKRLDRIRKNVYKFYFGKPKGKAAQQLEEPF